LRKPRDATAGGRFLYGGAFVDLIATMIPSLKLRFREVTEEQCKMLEEARHPLQAG
jgi:hypothetical protein